MLSRVADHLYWMGRYLQRVERLSQLFGAYLDLVLEEPESELSELMQKNLEALDWPGAQHWPINGSRLEAQHSPLHGLDPERITESLVFGQVAKDAEQAEGESNSLGAEQLGPSLLYYLSRARENAQQARDHISSEMWEHINGFYLCMRSREVKVTWRAQPEDIFRLIARSCRLHQGSADASMNRSEGWHFLRLGRYLEQAIVGTTLLESHFASVPFRPGKRYLERGEYLAWIMILRANRAGEAYTRTHTAELRPEHITRFLLLDPRFPQSVRFAAERVADALDAVTHATGQAGRGALPRLRSELLAAFPYNGEQGVLPPAPLPFLSDMRNRFLTIHRACYETYIHYPIEKAI